MAKKSKGKSFFIILLLVLNFLAVAGLIMSYLAPAVSPEKYWIFAFFGLAYPVILLINLVFVVIWLLAWKKYIFISIIAIAAGYTFILRMFSFSGKMDLPDKGKIKIMSYNVHSLYGVSKDKSGQGIHGEVTDFIASEKPDIVCIQEFLARDKDSLAILPKFAEAIGLPHYTYKNYYPIKDGRKVNAIAIFSRFPIIATGSLRLNNMNVFSVYADLEIGNEVVRLYNLHLKSIRLGTDDYDFYSTITEPEAAKQNIPLKEGALKIIRKLKNAFVVRARQTDFLVMNIKSSPYPCIICGDFNDTPNSYTYRKISSGLNDAYIKAGSGMFGNTYAGLFPSYRIDYILYNKIFKAARYTRYDINLSDHYPVSVYLKRE